MGTWEDCVEFHGHACPGLAIGCRASLEAARLLGLTFSADEQVVCVTENDACGVDAIQRLLGCSVGKGNLLFKLRGKQAFSFFNRKTQKSVRLVLKPLPDAEMSRPKRQEYILHAPDVFEIKPVTVKLPEKARLMPGISCAKCGETTMESMLRLENGELLCLDCVSVYSRIL